MEQIRDSKLEHAVICWPIRPPRTSMLVVVKGTFALAPGDAAILADTQELVTGELFHEDDPTRTVRYPSDFALLKPRGECFVTGSCRPLGPRAVDRTVASFTIGSVSKSLAVFGDRRWVRSQASPAVPFTEMPLAWERAFGGPSVDDNPAGRGMDANAEGEIWLPNIEDPARQIARPGDRPKPHGASPIGATWKARRSLTGTYDAEWQRTRFPWLAQDFRFAFFNEAPEDQRIEGYWRGDETIAIEHLHPVHPRLRTRLPGLRARAFVEREAGAFEEVTLSLDTITIDADRGVAYAVWRGAVELEHDRLAPDGLAKLFVMDEALGVNTAIDKCRARMTLKIAKDRAALSDLAGVAPPTFEEEGATIQSTPEEMAMLHAALQMDAQKRASLPPATDPLEKLKADMKKLGLDVDALTEEALKKAPKQEEMVPPDPQKLREAFEKVGLEMPIEVEQVLTELAQMKPPEAPVPEAAPERPDLRQAVIDAHRANRPIRGDFSGANLAELDLRGLDARDTILADVNLRGARLAGAKLDGASMIRADLLSADLSRASLRGADLSRAILEAAKLGEAVLDGATLDHAELQEANLERASLRKADLSFAILERADLSGAICDEATFNGARMLECKCTGASFVEARMYGVHAKQLKLDRADVTRIRVGRGSDLSGASVRNTKGAGSRWRDSKLEGVSFAGSTLPDADFTNAKLIAAQLSGCMLRRAVFQQAHLVGAALTGSDLFEGSFREANLSGADLRGANLFSADFFRALGEGVDLDRANLDGTIWERK